MKLYRVLDEDSRPTYAAGEAGALRRIEGDIFGDWGLTDRPVEPTRTLAPVAPPAIFAVGLNYRSHAAETDKPLPDYPVLFAKSAMSVIGPDDPILLPAAGPACVDYEVELAVVIGCDCRNVPADQAGEVILGCTVGNDVTARDWQKRLGQWVRGKSFDTFCPLGPCIDTEADPGGLDLQAVLNGHLVQQASTSDLIFSVPQLVEFISADLTLPAGTVIMTGTPAGVGVARRPQVFLRDGDRVTCRIEGIGELSNPVALADGADPDAQPVATWDD